MSDASWTVAPWRRPGGSVRVGDLVLGPGVAVRAGAAMARDASCDLLVVPAESASRHRSVAAVLDLGDDVASAASVVERAHGVALRIVGEAAARRLDGVAARCRELGAALLLRLDADEDPSWRRTLAAIATSVAAVDDVALAVQARHPRHAVQASRELATLTDRRLAAWLAHPAGDVVGRARSALVGATLLIDGLVDLVVVSSPGDENGAARDAAALVRLAADQATSRRLARHRFVQHAPPAVPRLPRPEWRSVGVDVGGVPVGGGAPACTFVLTGLWHQDARQWADRTALGDAAAAGAYVDCRGRDHENSALLGSGVLPRGDAGHLPAIVACDPFSADAHHVDRAVLEVGDAILVEPCLDWGHAVAGAASRVVASQRTLGVVVGPSELADGSDLVQGLAAMAVRAVREVLQSTGVVPLLSPCIWDVGSLVHVVRRTCSELDDLELKPPLVLDAARDAQDDMPLLGLATTIGPLLVDGIGDAVRAFPTQLQDVQALRAALA